MVEFLTQETVDLPALYHIAQTNRIAPLIYQALHSLPDIPPTIKTPFQKAYHHTVKTNLFLFHELAQVITQLQIDNMDVILLKGAALAQTIYPQIGLRPLGDLDLLVRQDDVNKVLTILDKAGYLPANPEVHTGAITTYENEILLIKKGSIDVLLEIHWHLIDSPHYQQHLNINWFWQTARPIAMKKVTALGLGTEAQIIYLCAHLWLHHQGQGLLWLYDIVQIIQQSPVNWDIVLQKVEECALVLPAKEVLNNLHQTWDIPIPTHFLKQLNTLTVSPIEKNLFTGLTTPHKSVLQRFWLDLQSFSTWQQRGDYFWQQLFPAPIYMKERYQIKTPQLLPLYYLYRWGLGIKDLVHWLIKP